MLTHLSRIVFYHINSDVKMRCVYAGRLFSQEVNTLSILSTLTAISKYLNNYHLGAVILGGKNVRILLLGY